MDLKDLMAQVTKLADVAATVIPQAKIVGEVAEIGGRVLDVIDTAMQHATPEQQDEMQAARAKLEEAVIAKANATSKRLRG